MWIGFGRCSLSEHGRRTLWMTVSRSRRGVTIGAGRDPADNEFYNSYSESCVRPEGSSFGRRNDQWRWTLPRSSAASLAIPSSMRSGLTEEKLRRRLLQPE